MEPPTIYWGSGSDFGKISVLFPVPFPFPVLVPDLNLEPDPEHI